MPNLPKIAIGVIFVSLVLTMATIGFNITESDNVQSSIQTKMQADLINLVENAYANGQADALKGNVRIHRINDTTVIFKKSPWDTKDTSKKWNSWKNRHIIISKPASHE